MWVTTEVDEVTLEKVFSNHSWVTNYVQAGDRFINIDVNNHDLATNWGAASIVAPTDEFAAYSAANDIFLFEFDNGADATEFSPVVDWGGWCTTTYVNGGKVYSRGGAVDCNWRNWGLSCSGVNNADEATCAGNNEEDCKADEKCAWAAMRVAQSSGGLSTGLLIGIIVGVVVVLAVVVYFVFFNGSSAAKAPEAEPQQ